MKARVRFALPKSWLNLTGSQPRLCTYPGLALGRSSAAYTPGFSLLVDQSKLICWHQKQKKEEQSQQRADWLEYLLTPHIISYLILTYYLSEFTAHIFIYDIFPSCHQIIRRVSSRRSIVSARSVKPRVHLRFLLQPCRGLGPLNRLQKPQPDQRPPR